VNDEVMFPDMAAGRRQAEVDSASGLRNTGELSNALFNGGLTSYRFGAPGKVRMPVLILAGAHDFAIGLAPQRELAKALPSARIVEYDRAGHFLYLDEPARFTRDVVEFLTSAKAARPAAHSP
jgi:proline iminopeptidase